MMSDNMEIRFGETVRLELGNAIPVPVRDYLLMINKPQINGHELVGNFVIRVGDLENDAGYLQMETDPTVPGWAKEPQKPTYTAEEVHALPDTTFIPSKESDLEHDRGYYIKPIDGIPLADLQSGLIPTKVSQLENDSRFYVKPVGGIPASDIDAALIRLLNGKMNSSLKGAPNGVAELDQNGMVPSHQLPSYVDDVKSYTSIAFFPAVGEDDKIYVDKSTNLQYRWGGTDVGYITIGTSLALGETANTAYRGDRGKAAYDHAMAKGQAYSSGLYKIVTNSEGHVIEAQAVTKNDIMALGFDDPSDKADKADTVLETTLSRGRQSGYPVGYGSFVWGSASSATKDYTTAFGFSIATSPYAFSEGYDTEANGYYSHAHGRSIIVNGRSAYGFGEYNIPDEVDVRDYPFWQPNTYYEMGAKCSRYASNIYGHLVLTAYTATMSHTSGDEFWPEVWDEGCRLKHVEIIGGGTSSSDRKNIRTLDWDGNEEIAGKFKGYGLILGDYASCTGNNAIAQSTGSTASGEGSLASGGGATASGYAAEARGFGCVASGACSRAGGAGSASSGDNSFSHGSGVRTPGNSAVAFGGGTEAAGDYSMSVGESTRANGQDQFVCGKFNIGEGDGSTRNLLFIIGNGTSADRSNAFAVDVDGNLHSKGFVYVGCNPDGTGGLNLINEVRDKYTKPSDGIPASDLAAGVIPDISSKIDATEKGAANGVAMLDALGKVSSSQLPSMESLPAVSSADNGKILQVVNGAWAAVMIPSANGVSF